MIPSAIAGYGCIVNGESVEDSNFGGTSESCTGQGGEWWEYTCEIAEGHLPLLGEFYASLEKEKKKNLYFNTRIDNISWSHLTC